jgi:hypothetical protein
MWKLTLGCGRSAAAAVNLLCVTNSPHFATNSLFFKKWAKHKKINLKNVPKVVTINCLQYESVFKILYFDIFSITKFG